MEATGQPTCLVISDLDAGVGTFKDTQNTVNTQNLQGTLMALCDEPEAVSCGQDWAAVRARGRVPIYVSANDLNCLYAVSGRSGGRAGGCGLAGARRRCGWQLVLHLLLLGLLLLLLLRAARAPRPNSLQPLVREGRMDKMYFEPTRDEMAAALRALFAPGLDAAAVDVLLASFSQQPMDFFGALKARLVDRAVGSWLRDAGKQVRGEGWRGGGRGDAAVGHARWLAAPPPSLPPHIRRRAAPPGSAGLGGRGVWRRPAGVGRGPVAACSLGGRRGAGVRAAGGA